MPALIAALLVSACGPAASTTPGATSATASPTAGFPGAQLPAGSVVIRVPATTSQNNGVERLVAGDGAVWASDGLFRIDTATNRVAAGLDTTAGDDDQYLAVDGSTVWASDFNAGAVRRFDASTGKLVATIAVESPASLDVHAGTVWVASHETGTVYRIDSATNTVVGHTSVAPNGPGGPQGLALGGGSVWTGAPFSDEVIRIDAATGAVTAKTTTPVEPCGGVAVTPTSVWTSQCFDGRNVVRLDAATGAVAATYDTGGVVDSFAVEGDNVWFVTGEDPGSGDEANAYLEEMNDSGTVLQKIPLGMGFPTAGIAIAGGSIWVSCWTKPLVFRIPLS